MHAHAKACTHTYYGSMYIQKNLAHSFNPELHVYCGPKSYEGYRISVVYVILPALKKHYSLWKTQKIKDTLRHEF